MILSTSSTAETVTNSSVSSILMQTMDNSQQQQQSSCEDSGGKQQHLQSSSCSIKPLQLSGVSVSGVVGGNTPRHSIDAILGLAGQRAAKRKHDAQLLLEEQQQHHAYPKDSSIDNAGE
ncbi:hypothetical protein QAD02_000587 [Eretmocerus hayati]|uniref:Uncharacterized protein n=1 Tax=Eretmocerus hayati TaxID=131215 RepID=A0ACC2NEG5_9HYME|nr:hypothetical protein QAD02_000587 [Eretmocerus hayati]